MNLFSTFQKTVFTQKNAMKKSILATFILMTGMSCYANEDTHWGYNGNVAPEHWGELNEAYKTCSSGKNQTPINISNTYLTKSKYPISINYKLSAQSIVFNGHTVQVNAQDNNENYILIDGQKFFLKQFHFHAPSENTINGKSFPLEMHFVNANAQGQLTVLAVMAELGDENPVWNQFWKDLSTNENDPKPLSSRINIEKLLPNSTDYYRFSGSLTTPPCSEGVNWIVLKNPITISITQLENFKSVLKQFPNNRPIQETNGRVIVEN